MSETQCTWPIGHRHRSDHHCGCNCCLRKDHDGPHLCAWEHQRLINEGVTT